VERIRRGKKTCKRGREIVTVILYRVPEKESTFNSQCLNREERLPDAREGGKKRSNRGKRYCSLMGGYLTIKKRGTLCAISKVKG